MDPLSSLVGIVNKGCPIKKRPGVKQSKSKGSVEAGVSGREFKIASIWQIMVVNSSRVKVCSPITFTIKDFVDLTAASHTPPTLGVYQNITQMNQHKFAN